MNTLFEFLGNKRSLYVLLILFAILNFSLTYFMPKDQALDLKFAYSVEEAYLLLGQLNQSQREFYCFGAWALDLPYMIVYTLFFSGILYRLWNKKRIAWIAFFILLADFFENIFILQVLKNYPSHLSDTVMYASIFTTSKWIFVGVVLLSIVGGLVNRYFQFSFSVADSKGVRA
ncbi:hypothetical protein ACFPIK_01875 [Algoriphagus aquatilis]|uniref:Uncharacterized protein n=1 Tax=Algoriphagus aquatilis TaxID=490186 RepID=A0ABW0BSC5_9BACT|nr:hypothetical protein [Algoriphagus sp.]